MVLGNLNRYIYKKKTRPPYTIYKNKLKMDLRFKCKTRNHKTPRRALAGVAQWIEHRPANQRVASSTPSLGHMPGLWARSPVQGK